MKRGERGMKKEDKGMNREDRKLKGRGDARIRRNTNRFDLV